MSSDVRLVDKETGATLTSHKSIAEGGTYVMPGTKEMALNVTWNYSIFYYKFLDKDEGLKWLNGKTGLEDVRFEFDRAHYSHGFKWAFNYRAQHECTGSTSIFEDLLGPTQYFTVILHGCEPDPFVVYEDVPGDGNSEVRP